MPIPLACYDDLLHRVYDCALAPARWPETLAAVAEVFGAHKVALWTFLHGAEQGGIFYTHALDPRDFAAFATVSATEDPFVQALFAKRLLIEGAAYKESDLLPREQVVRSRLYRELWAPLDIDQVAVGIVFAGTDGRQLPVAICLYRSARDPGFDDAEIDLLRRLLAHLSRALGVMFHLRDAAHRVATHRAALDRLGAGVVLLDSVGGVRYANPVAERLLADGSIVRRGPPMGAGPTLRHPAGADRLAPADGSTPPGLRFADAVAAAITADREDDAEHFCEALVLPDRDGRPGVVMNAAPLAPNDAFGLGSGEAPVRAIVFLHELSGRSKATAEPLRRVFGMTPAEAAAALQLLEGGSVAEMAARSGVTVNTFKTQLKAAYAKSGTSRQAGLLRLMLSLANG